MLKTRKLFYGWWMAIAASILYVFAGGTFFYGFTVFFNPIRSAFGWTAAVTSIAFVIQRLESGVAGPIVGFVVDRVGPRKLMLAGWGVVGLGFLLMSQINSLWAFYVSFLIIGTGFSFGSFVTINTAIANWFIKKRSRAITLVYLGFGASGLLVPIIALLIDRFGWRESLIIVGIVLWVIGIPLSMLMRDKPGRYGYLPDGEIRAATPEPTDLPDRQSSNNEIKEPDLDYSVTGFTAKAAMRTKAFWLLSLVWFFQHIGTSSVFVHIVPYLESVQFPRAQAATVVTGMTICSIIGRVLFGFLGDFANKRYLIAIAIAFQTIGIFIFAFIDIDRAWLVILFLLTYAPGYGGPIPLRPAMQADYFGIRSFGTIMGVMSAISMLGGLASPVVAGWIFDITGSYHLAWLSFGLITIPAIPLILLARPPKAREEPPFTDRVG